MPEQTVDIAENASVEHQQESVNADAGYEAEASKMGWRPKEQFRGDESRWVDAKTFVERGHEVLPIVKAELRKTREELAEVRQAAQEFYKLTEEAATRREAEWKSKYERAVLDKSDAISKGDGEAAIEAESRQKELEANRPQQPKKEAKPHPSFVEWVSRNDWFNADTDKTDLAIGIGLRLRQKGLEGDEFFSELDKEMERRSAPVSRAGPQRGGKPSAAGGGGARSYDNLKPEFKTACDKQVKALGIKREQYVGNCSDDMFRGS